MILIFDLQLLLSKQKNQCISVTGCLSQKMISFGFRPMVLRLRFSPNLPLSIKLILNFQKVNRYQFIKDEFSYINDSCQIMFMLTKRSIML